MNNQNRKKYAVSLVLHITVALLLTLCAVVIHKYTYANAYRQGVSDGYTKAVEVYKDTQYSDKMDADDDK